MVSLIIIFYEKKDYVVYRYKTMSIDCSRQALNSSLWNKITDNGDKNVTIGYFNDHFINKWGEVEGTSVHSSSFLNGSVYTTINNDNLGDNLGNLVVEWAARSDGSAKVEIITQDDKIRDSDIISKSEEKDLIMNKKQSNLNYKNGDTIKISETEGAGVIFVKSINFVDVNDNNQNDNNSNDNNQNDNNVDDNNVDDNNQNDSKKQYIDEITPIVNNILQDMDFIDKINIQMKKWVSNGISIPEIAFNQILTQKENAKLKLEDMKNKLIQEVNVIDRVDKDLKSHKSLHLQDKDYTFEEVVGFYHQTVSDLHHSISELEKIKEDLENYKNFGADIGDSIQSLTQQMGKFKEKISNSEVVIDSIIKDADQFAKLIDEMRN